MTTFYAGILPRFRYSFVSLDEHIRQDAQTGLHLIVDFIVFVTLALLYRLVMWLMSKSEKLEDLLEGKPVVIVEDIFDNHHRLPFEQIFQFLTFRHQPHDQPVQQCKRHEDDKVDDEVKPGLCILPDMLIERYKTVPEAGEYACIKCSHVVVMQAGESGRMHRPGFTSSSG